MPWLAASLTMNAWLLCTLTSRHKLCTVAVGTRPTKSGLTASVTSTMDNPSMAPKQHKLALDSDPPTPNNRCRWLRPQFLEGAHRQQIQAFAWVYRPAKPSTQGFEPRLRMPSQASRPRKGSVSSCSSAGCKGTTNRPAVMLHVGAVRKARKPLRSVDVWQEAELLAVAEHLACEIVRVGHLHRHNVALGVAGRQTFRG